MNSPLGMKVLVGVLALISIVLAWNLYRTKPVARVPMEFEGVLTSEPPGTQTPIRIRISEDNPYTTGPDRETATVDPSIQYKELTWRVNGIAVQGQILAGKLQRTK